VVYGDSTYRYDDDGYLMEKVTPDGTTTYEYGAMGELLSVTTPEHTITYEHNALNQRVAKRIDGVVVEKYLWADLTTLLAVYDAEDNLVQRFEYAGGRMPVAMTDTNGTTYYLHYDQVGSLRAISRVLSPDNTTQLVKEITYDTYGNILTDSNSSLRVLGFAGGLYDADTGLTRFGYRDYDAFTGKWTAKDPIGFAGGDSNLYGYVLGNPVGFVDLNGLDPRLNGRGVPAAMGGDSNKYSPFSGNGGAGYGGGFMFRFGGVNAHIQYLTDGTKQTIICGRAGIGMHFAAGGEASGSISQNKENEDCPSRECTYSWTLGGGGDLHFGDAGWGGSVAGSSSGAGAIGDIPGMGLGLGAEGGVDLCLVITCPIN